MILHLHPGEAVKMYALKNVPVVATVLLVSKFAHHYTGMNVVVMVTRVCLHLPKLPSENAFLHYVIVLFCSSVQTTAWWVSVGERCPQPAVIRPSGLTVGLAPRHRFPNGLQMGKPSLRSGHPAC